MAGLPVAVERELDLLRAAVARTVPAKDASNLLIGTWNLRAFGDVSATWAAGPHDSPKRDWRAVARIAAVVSAFDVVAVQEVRRSTQALRFLLAQLGPTWRVIASDVTEGGPGNGERLAFVYDTARVQPSGLVGEIVLPAAVGTPARQFARTPYAASFRRGTVEVILTTVHVLWASAAARLPEIQAFVAWMRTWADRHDDWNQNLLVLGDFNLDRAGNPLFEAFIATGLWPPTALSMLPRTIFDDDKDRHFYDQIAWFSTPEGRSLLDSLTFTGRAGSFDFVPLTLDGGSRAELSWRVSDHFPLWVEFRV